MQMIDLHTHSTASDGSLSPTLLIELAASRGLSAIALTDHDTIGGLDEAAEAAKRLGIRFIPGVELEISWEPGEFHLLALGLKAPSPSFVKALADLAQGREERNKRILDLMKEMGIDASYEEVASYSQGKVLGRPHFAALLVARKIVKNKQQAFAKYLGKGRPFYTPKTGLELRKAIELIKESGAVAILAHPLSLYVSWGRLEPLIIDFKAQGLDGIEAWHPTARKRPCERLEVLGRSLGLLITAGSDFHGDVRPDRKLGITAGDTKITENYLEGIPFISP